ncbi:MAG: DUF927 domain-containing protein, partial [Actinobacteria bacterium]|nr:DUF927 domain-containing protein [Actinomycetota bacterium]
MRKQFYEKALPTQGVYCVAMIHAETKRTRHEYVYNVDELEEVLGKYSSQTDYNVYVAPCSFQDESRNSNNAAFGRSFFIDLDVNHGSVCYTSKEEALNALEEFVAEHDLPPPVRIDSGGGIQAYWLFEDDVEAEEWKLVAALFKQFCMDKGLLIDPAVTADAARIMRCPETMNLRVQTPSKFIDDDFNQYDFSAFKSFLGGEEVPQTIEQIKVKTRGMDEETKAIARLDNFEDSFAVLAEKSLSGDGCNQIKYAIENRETLPYGLWFGALSVAQRCVDRDAAIKAVSEDHPDYTFEKASLKAQETTKASGPWTCTKFGEENPDGCEGCPFKGKITSPIALARKIRMPTEATAPLPEIDDTVWGDADSQDLLIFPEYLEPFSRSARGSIMYTPPATVDKTGKVTQPLPIELLTRPVYPYKRMFSPHDGECLMIRTVMPFDGHREFMLPVDHVYSSEHLTKAVVQSGATFDPDKTKFVMKYFIRWAEYLSSIGRAEQMRMQMGWTEDRDGFVIGNTEIKSNGEVVRSAASPLVRNVAQHLKPVGDYATWKQATTIFNRPGFEMQAFGMLTGFGSPLMSLTTVAGASLCFLSAHSGTGKTGSLYASISIWGQPKELSLVDQGATQNGFIGRYLNLKNLPLGIDEASNAKPEDLAKLIHAVSHGKAKIRMQSSVNAEREHESSASMITFFTSNQSIYNKLETLKGSPDGEMARLIEFRLKPPDWFNDDIGIEHFNKFRFNYGHAGIEFIQHYFKRGEPYVKALVDKWYKRFNEVVGNETGYRFYRNIVAATFAGGELAIEAGIIQLDIERVFRAIILEIIQLKEDTVKLNNTDYPALITEFFLDHWAG